MVSKSILLSGFEGFFLSVSMSSEERLMISLDVSGLDWNTYKSFIYEIQDLMSEVDDSFNSRASKGRRIKARHRKVENRRMRYVRFSPLPSTYSNSVKKIREKVYDIVNMYCIRLQSLYEENVRRNVYLLPSDNAKRLVEEIERLNRDIDELNRGIQRYIHTSYYDEIIDILDNYGLLGQVMWITEKPEEKFVLGHIRLTMLPVKISPSIVDEWARISPSVAKMLEETRKSVVRNVVEKEIGEIKNIINILRSEKLRKKSDPEHIKSMLEALRTKTKSIGLKALTGEIDRLIDMVDKPIKPIKISELEKSIDDRIATLI